MQNLDKEKISVLVQQYGATDLMRYIAECELQVTQHEKILRCSWCGKPKGDVRHLIAGAGGYICDKCVDLCRQIIDDEEGRTVTK